MEAVPTSTPPADAGARAFVESSIERLRLKLLDLTTRNPLIAFRHAARSRRFVRVIDELPDQLFARLEGDAGMRFRSLGHPADEPDDEKAVPFRRALAAARIEDPVYLEKLKALGDDPGELAVEQMERDYRAHLRRQLGMPPRRPGPVQTPADAARAAGLDPSFDLPPQPPKDTEADKHPPRHGDAFIQTALFEDDMQLTLARTREVVRLSIDEAGVNPLFCVFGFLEWYEDAHSSTPLHAPLLLLPLVVDRKLARGQYQYVVRAAGEEPQVNVAIAERLKRDFDLVLPDHDPDDTPEQYFLKVQEVIGGTKAWRLRRWITVGLFSFSRIAMYHDLAPERWSAAGGLASHPGLSRILGGGSAPGTSPNAPPRRPPPTPTATASSTSP